MKNKVKEYIWLPSLLLVFSLYASEAMAEIAGMVIATDPSQVNHYPGLDGLIGTGDDVVSNLSTGVNASRPNTGGSYGYNAFKFQPFGPDDPALPTGYDAITFVRGTVSINTDVFANGGGSIVNSMYINSGTEPFPGHGAYTSRVTEVNSGSYNPATKEFSMNVDFQYTILGSVSSEPGVDIMGTAIYQAAADFAISTGNDYFENVVKPLALSQGATGATLIDGAGQLTTLGFPIKFNLVALEGLGFTINPGLNDAWGVEGVPNQGVFITMYEKLGLAFFAMFTYDSVMPVSNTATLGASDQRWLTALGTILGNTISANVELTTGGIFDSSDPTPTQDTSYGTMSVEFHDCYRGTLTYNMPGPGLSGEMKLFRFVYDNVPSCEEKGYEAGPGL